MDATRDGEADVVLTEFFTNAMQLLRSASFSHDGFRQAFDAVQQAAVAAKAEDHDEVLRLLKSQVVRPLADAISAEIPRLVAQAVKDAIGPKFPTVVADTLKTRITEEIVRDLCEKSLQGFFDERKALAWQIQQMSEIVKENTTAISRFSEIGHDEALMALAAPGFAARMREQAAAKVEIGRHVAEVFYTSGKRASFVLASSTAVHFGQQLRRCSRASGCLFITNSIAFPLAVFNDRSQHEVWTWCGRNFDDQCGGWLPIIGDDQYFNAMRFAFQPNSYALTTAVLTPRKLSVDMGMLFFRPEAMKIARTLVEAAQEVILMLPADRLRQTLDVSDQAGAFPPGANWRSLGKRIHAVIAGTPSEQDPVPLLQALSQQGLTVHVQMQESAEWIVYPAA